MIRIDVRTDDAMRYLDRMRTDLRDKVLVMAINKTAEKARTEMTRAITSEYAIKAGDVRSRLRLMRARRGLIEAVLDPFASRRRGRSLNLIHFMERSVSLAESRRRKRGGTQDQLRFQIKKQGGKKTITGAFIGNKGRTVFKREGAARLPIKALSTIDVPSMFNAKHIMRRVLGRVDRELMVEIERAVRYVMEKNR